MKKLLCAGVLLSVLCGVASAAEIAPRPRRYAPPPPPPPPPIFMWSGFYVGGNIGGAWFHRELSDSFFGFNFDNGSKGVFIGGGQLGYNAQFNNVVLGVEWDFDWAGNNNNTGNGVFIPGHGLLVVSSNNRFISTLAARFGLAYGPWLFYGKAGGGWVGNNDFTITNVTTGASISGFRDRTGGWLLGAGIEWAFAPSWSAKIEYDFLGLEDRTFIVPPGFLVAGDAFTSRNRNVQMLKVGLNYRFGWGFGGPGYGGPGYGGPGYRAY
jgi:outer membrane immunogenic protein